MFVPEKEQLTRKQLIEKKKKLKAMFDAEYDDKEGSSFYDDLKRDLDQQAQVSPTSSRRMKQNRNNGFVFIFSTTYSYCALYIFYLFLFHYI